MKVDQSGIHKLSLSEDIHDRFEAIKQLETILKSFPDNFSAWDDLVRLAKLANDEAELTIAREALHVLFISFKHLPDKCKPQAWLDFVTITDPGYFLEVREDAACSLGSIFEYLPDEYKSTAWIDLVRLIADNSYIAVKLSIISVIDSFFKCIPDEYKSSCWADLQRLTVNKDPEIRESAVVAIGSIFMLIPDECIFQAWDDLHKLTNDECSNVRERAAESIGSVFSSLPEKFKLQALADLHELTADENSCVRESVVDSIGSLFLFISDEHKPHTWNDLRELTNDIDNYVRQKAVVVLDLLFPDIPDEFKSQAWYDLVRLAGDNNSKVKMYANHSLGKICIYKASESENEEDSRALFEDALQYFEKAAQEIDSFNPAKFCNIFYHSFDVVFFKKVYSKKEIDNYIEAAKREIGGSESKQKLVEAVEKLAEVLEIAHYIHESGGDWQESLKYCSDICNHVDQLMDENKDKTPAIHDLYKKIKPSFDKTIKELIDEVKEKTEIACREAKGTPDADIACRLYKETQKLDDVADFNLNLEIVASIAFNLRGKINQVPAYHYLLPELEKLSLNLKLDKKLGIIRDILGVVEFGSQNKEAIERINRNVQAITLNTEQIVESIEKMKIMLKPDIREEIQVTVGLSAYGSGTQHVITFPIQEISYPELKEDLQRYTGKMTDIAQLPARLKEKVVEYIRKNKD